MSPDLAKYLSLVASARFVSVIRLPNGGRVCKLRDLVHLLHIFALLPIMTMKSYLTVYPTLLVSSTSFLSFQRDMFNFFLKDCVGIWKNLDFIPRFLILLQVSTGLPLFVLTITLSFLVCLVHIKMISRTIVRLKTSSERVGLMET